MRYITAHNKWAIHSQYFDNLHMLTLGRGGQTIWMSPQDADKIGVKDNEWVEAYNRNGIVARAPSSPTASPRAWSSCTTPRSAP